MIFEAFKELPIKQSISVNEAQEILRQSRADGRSPYLSCGAVKVSEVDAIVIALASRENANEINTLILTENEANSLLTIARAICQRIENISKPSDVSDAILHECNNQSVLF